MLQRNFLRLGFFITSNPLGRRGVVNINLRKMWQIKEQNYIWLSISYYCESGSFVPHQSDFSICLGVFWFTFFNLALCTPKYRIFQISTLYICRFIPTDDDLIPEIVFPFQGNWGPQSWKESLYFAFEQYLCIYWTANSQTHFRDSVMDIYIEYCVLLPYKEFTKIMWIFLFHNRRQQYW